MLLSEKYTDAFASCFVYLRNLYIAAFGKPYCFLMCFHLLTFMSIRWRAFMCSVWFIRICSWRLFVKIFILLEVRSCFSISWYRKPHLTGAAENAGLKSWRPTFMCLYYIHETFIAQERNWMLAVLENALHKKTSLLHYCLWNSSISLLLLQFISCLECKLKVKWCHSFILSACFLCKIHLVVICHLACFVETKL